MNHSNFSFAWVTQWIINIYTDHFNAKIKFFSDFLLQKNGSYYDDLTTLFFYKNIFYKNIEAEICEILRIF